MEFTILKFCSDKKPSQVQYDGAETLEKFN